ncbi:Voltage-gated Ion Channel (VIC) Superfamily [Thraustotheca clavata]|uniref:Voltage-gated Ion Channel (VIC) Superfamily n=1 Tax=Thraustotheca clavata TaxID=74557 RepID=A0A1V9YRK2_9STRA|nr:Voltage-gated Ion Channel (VIC) Superfamily [Thraustotheca clavata]
MASELYENLAIKKNHNWILPLNSPYKMTWDTIVAIVMIIFIGLLPLELCFDLSSTIVETKLCLLLADVIFNLDIILYFRTSTLDPRTQEEITDYRQIARKYLRFWFWIDLLSAYPTLIIEFCLNPLHGIIQPFNLTKLLRLTVLLRARKLSQRPVFQKILIQWLELGINPATIRLVEITVLYLLLHHYLACLYYMTVVAELEYLGDTLEGIQLWELPFDMNGTAIDKYVGAFFQAATVMGAYTLRPKTTVERLFTGFGLVVAVVLFGIVADLLKARSKVAMEQYNQMQAISTHLRACQIQEDVKLRILEFYNGAWTIENAHHADKLFAHLPENLLVLLNHHLHQSFSKQVPFLRYLGSEGLMKVIMALRTLVALKDEIIIRSGEKPHAIYLIELGHVEVYELAKNGNRLILAVLHTGNTFGEDSVLSGESSIVNVVALTYCKFYVLYKDAFDLIHSQHQPKNSSQHRPTMSLYRRSLFLNIAHSVHTELTVLKKWNHVMKARKKRISQVVKYMRRVSIQKVYG